MNCVILYGEADSSVAKSRPITKKYTKEGSIIWHQELMTFGIDTRNGCNFNLDEFKQGLEDPYVTERISGKRFFSEMDHPPKDNFERFTTVELKNIAYRINRFWFEGNKLYAECETLETERGRDLRALIEANAEVTVSFRGYGIPKPEGGEKMVIVAFDVVYHPSNPTATSVEESFKDKLYSEGYNARQITARMIESGLASYKSISSNHNVYAESAGTGCVPQNIIASESGEVYGFTYTTKEDVKKNNTFKSFRSRLRGF